MTKQNATELWRLAQAAFDQKRLPSEDGGVLDWLMEHPEQAFAMDEILILEERLLGLAAPYPARSRRPWVWLGLAAAGVLAVWGPSLWNRAEVRGTNSSEPHAPTPLSEGDAGSHGGVLAVLSQAPAPVANIVSFELAIQHSESPIGRTTRHASEANRSNVPSQATVHTLTSTRTRTAPRGANLTY